MVLFRGLAEPEGKMTLRDGDDDPVDTTVRKLQVLPTTPVGIANYRLSLRPGEERMLDFVMPVEPVPPGDPLIQELRAARYDEYLGRTISMWENMTGQGMQIFLPEPKVVNTFKASLIYDLIAFNKVDSSYIQTVND